MQNRVRFPRIFDGKTSIFLISRKWRLRSFLVIKFLILRKTTFPRAISIIVFFFSHFSWFIGIFIEPGAQTFEFDDPRSRAQCCVVVFQYFLLVSVHSFGFSSNYIIHFFLSMFICKNCALLPYLTSHAVKLIDTHFQRSKKCSYRKMNSLWPRCSILIPVNFYDILFLAHYSSSNISHLYFYVEANIFGCIIAIDF